MTPNRFRSELKRFDSALDIEWNGAKGQWEIVGVDRQNKKYLIKKIPLGQMTTLGGETLKELYDCSPLKQGGSKRMNEYIDDLIMQDEEAENKELQDYLDAYTSDAWMHLQHKNGYRVSMHIPTVSGGTVTFIDKRRVSAD